MDWIVDLSQKIAASLDTEGVMTMHEDAFDFVHHQLQTIGDAIENQFQTVSANIENHLQTIRANIELHCSASKWDESNPELLDPENKNIERTALKSSVRSLDLNLSEQEDSKLVVEEKKSIKLKAPESPILASRNNAGKGLKIPSAFLDTSDEDDSKIVDFEDEHIFNSRKGLESSSTFVVDSDEEDSKLPNSENENVDPTAQESSVIFSEIKSLKGLDGLEKSFTFSGDSDSDEFSFAKKYLEEFYGRKYVDDSDSEDFKDGSIQEDMKELEFDNMCAVDKKLCSLCFIEEVVEDPSLCSLCLQKIKSDSNKKITSEAYATKAEIIYEQECEQPVPNRETRNFDLNLEYEQPVPNHEIRNFDINLLEDESSNRETADFDFCDSDWEVI